MTDGEDKNRDKSDAYFEGNFLLRWWYPASDDGYPLRVYRRWLRIATKKRLALGLNAWIFCRNEGWLTTIRVVSYMYSWCNGEHESKDMSDSSTELTCISGPDKRRVVLVPSASGRLWGVWGRRRTGLEFVGSLPKRSVPRCVDRCGGDEAFDLSSRDHRG